VSGASIIPLAQIAVLLVLFGAFVGLLFWLFRPGAREAARQAAAIPFRGEGEHEA